MALTFNERKGTTMAKITVDRRLWLTSDGDLVEDGHSDAAFLWAVEGREVSQEDAERVGYRPASKSRDTSTSKPQKDDDGFVCEVCGKTAKSKAGLSAHMRSHDDEG